MEFGFYRSTPAATVLKELWGTTEVRRPTYLLLHSLASYPPYLHQHCTGERIAGDPRHLKFNVIVAYVSSTTLSVNPIIGRPVDKTDKTTRVKTEHRRRINYMNVLACELSTTLEHFKLVVHL